MLCQFSFKNYSSYRDETTFDFQAASIPEFSDSVLRQEGCSDLLPVGVLYGPNGGGKTNLLWALSCLISLVVRPIHELEKNRNPLIVQQSADCTPFLFDETSSHEPTEFRIYFREKGNEYQYYLSIFEGEIIAESLSRRKIGAKKPARLFDRDENGVVLGPSLRAKGLNKSVNAKMPYLSFLAINYDLDYIRDAQDWFEACIILNYANPVAESQIILSMDDAFEKNFIRLLNDMDIDISGYRFDDSDKNIYLQRVLNDRSYELPFSKESAGTQKLFAALPVVLIALREGRLLVIDELDAKLHPKLLRHVISLFKNPEINKHGAQLLFTSQDISTMKNTVFRRDEIWFAALGDDHASEIYSLYDIRREDDERVNSTAAFDKQYLEGRYGADPYLQNMLDVEAWQ